MRKLLLTLLLLITLFCKSQFCYVISNIAYAPDSYITGTNLGLNADDQFSGTINIGFPFCYDGNIYNQCLISSNAYISFNLGLAGGFSDWAVAGPIPTALPATIKNSILGIWQDLYIPTGGTIRYQTLGAFPNRRFVVSFLNINYFGSFVGDCPVKNFKGQIVLFETSYNIEIRIEQSETCNAPIGWNNGWAIEGLNNALGTAAFPIAGRNAASFTILNDAKRFTYCGPCLIPLKIEADTTKPKLPIEHIEIPSEIKSITDLYGNDFGKIIPTDFKGTLIIKYEDGSYKKILKY